MKDTSMFLLYFLKFLLLSLLRTQEHFNERKGVALCWLYSVLTDFNPIPSLTSGLKKKNQIKRYIYKSVYGLWVWGSK